VSTGAPSRLALAVGGTTCALIVAVPRLCSLVALCIAGLLLGGCGKGAAAPPEPGSRDTATHPATPPANPTTPPANPSALATAPAAAAPAPAEEHGSRWRDDDDDGGERVGGFQIFKEAWVYVDGEPVGVLREIEMPAIPVAWTDKVEFLDFNKGDPGPHQRTYQRSQWRLADYLRAIGLDLRAIKLVVIHGGRGVVGVPGPLLRRHADGLRFDLTGNAWNKLRVFFPAGMTLNTTYDRYVAVSVYVDKPPPQISADHQLMLDGQLVGGIPYHGSPQRGGIRIYLDDRLALVIKRNALGDTGRVSLPGERERWTLGKLLAARGIDASDVVAADVIYDEDRRRLTSIDPATFEFGTLEKVSGEIELLPSATRAQELILFRRGHVPAPWVRAPRERDPDGTVKEP
jgi:hypothetical protein